MNILPVPGRYSLIYQKIAKYIFIVTNSIALFVNLADIAYFPFTMKRTTSLVFDQFVHETNKLGLVIQFSIDYWYVLFLFILCCFFLYKAYDITSIKKTDGFPQWKEYVSHTLLFLFFGFLIWGGLRGGFRHSTRPISLSNAGKYVDKPIQMAIVQNTPFAIIRTLGKHAVKPVHYFPDSVQESIFSAQKDADTGGFRKKNVVLILLESWSREFVGALNRELNDSTFLGYTPFFDSLIGKSLTFKYAFANGRKSIEALPSAMAGIPSMEVPYVLSHYSNNTVTSLATELKKKGYVTSFFHGAPNGSMGFDSFVKMAGIEHYYGKTEYGNDADYDGIWGIWDEEFFQYFAQEMDTMEEPFFASIFSVSSHHPYAVPERYEHVFPETENPLIRCLGYTDLALRRFFETAQKMPWYNNTLFVLTADHSSFPMHEYFTNDLGTFSIPLVFFDPEGKLSGFDEKRVAQQIDILPTVLDYLNFDEPYIAFGKSLLDSTSADYAVNYINGYQLVTPDYLLQFNGEKTTGLYRYKTDRKLEENLIGRVDESVNYDTIENFLKAFVQEYNRRIANNQLQATAP